jgi:hypothetical protein
VGVYRTAEYIEQQKGGRRMTEKTKKQETEMKEACCCGNGADARHKAVPRSDLQIKQLKGPSEPDDRPAERHQPDAG